MKPDDVFASVYGRADAIKDRQMFDVTTVATAAGFIYPVAVTRGVMADCAEWKDEDTVATGQRQEPGTRLMDLLVMARYAACRGDFGIDFRAVRLPRPGRDKRRYVDLKLVLNMEDAAPVLTIMHR